MSWWDTIKTIGSGVGTALDWLGDNDWIVDTVTRLAYDHPEMDYDKLMEMAIQEAVINSPDVNTQFTRTSTDIDPETGKRTVNQVHRGDVAALLDALVQQAGAPINTYAAPDSMRGQMLEGYMNDRERHMGLPLSEWSAPSFQREGVSGVNRNYWDDDEDEESDPATTGRGAGGSPGDGAFDPGKDTVAPDRRKDPLFDSGFSARQQVDDLIRAGMEANPGMSPKEIDWTATINDYIGQKGDTIDSPIAEWLLQHGGDLGKIIGGIFGPPGSGFATEGIVDFLTEKMYWDRGGTLQSPAPGRDINDITGMQNRDIDDRIESWMRWNDGGGLPPQYYTGWQNPGGDGYGWWERFAQRDYLRDM